MNIPPKTAIPQRTAAGLNRKPGPMPGKPNIRPPIFTPQTQTTSNDPKQQLSNSKELDSNKDSKEQPDPSLEKPTQIPPVNQEQANPIQSISTKQNQPTQIPPMKQEQPRPIQNMPPKQNPPLQNAFPKKEPSDQGPHIPKEQEKTEPFPKQPVMKQERKETEITGYSDQSSHHHQPSHGSNFQAARGSRITIYFLKISKIITMIRMKKPLREHQEHSHCKILRKICLRVKLWKNSLG